MAFSRYKVDDVLGFSLQYGTANAIRIVRDAIEAGNMAFTETLLRGGERLDTIAGREYGDSRLWWVIAAASDIGWCAQVPAGTYIIIPSLDDIIRIFD